MDLLDVFQKEEIRPSVKVVCTILWITKDAENETRFSDEKLSSLVGLSIPVIAYSRGKIIENKLAFVTKDGDEYIYKLIDNKKASAFDISTDANAPF